MNTQNEKKNRLGALDIFIILAVVVCIVSIGWRYISIKDDSTNNSVSLDNYIVSFDIYNIRKSSADNYLEVGTEFFIDDGDAFFGTLREQISILDTEKFYTTAAGDVIRVTSTGTGEQDRVDFKGTMNCSGVMNENGSFLLNGNLYLGIDKQINLYTKYLSVSIKITGISPDVSTGQ